MFTVPLSLRGLRALFFFFFFLALNNISLSGCTVYPSPVEGRLGGFQVLAVRTKSASVLGFVRNKFSTHLGKYQGQ